MEGATAPAALDLSGCENEPIRFPGSIQPHGFLLLLSETHDILQASDNLARHTGVEAADALGRSLAAVIGAAAHAELLAELARIEIGARPAYLGTAMLHEGRHFDVLAHQAEGRLVLEFEAVRRHAPADFRHLYPLVGDFLTQLNDTADIEAMCRLAARKMRAVTGFGRVLFYQFDEHGHGHVIAEEREPAYPSYLGQHFPASDIPRQARELYLQNRIRLIQDANYTPARLVPPLHPDTGAPNDLSFATLRSVSPVHLQYLRNMHTLASMSVSLVVRGRLWGLASCHNSEPAPVDFDKRTACEQLGQILALVIETREDAAELQFRLEVRRMMVTVLAGLTQGSDVVANIGSMFPLLMQFARAGAIALVLDDRVLTHGEAPGESEIRALVAWLGLHGHGDTFHTDCLSAVYPDGAGLVRHASGLLALRISRIHPHYLLWFRPEMLHTIDWAGNPNDDTSGPLTPRSSFASWRETIHATSLPWHAGELEMAVEFRTALLGIALERAGKMAELSEALARANKALEALSQPVAGQ